MAWLEAEVDASGSGRDLDELEVRPDGRFFLGRLAPEDAVIELARGERGERIDPCACGLSVLPIGPGPWSFLAVVRASVWLRGEKGHPWTKHPIDPVKVSIELSRDGGSEQQFSQPELGAALLAAAGIQGLSAEVRIDIESGTSGIGLNLILVNTSPKEVDGLADTNLYEVELEVRGLETRPFQLTGTADTFRYERAVDAYGINGGVLRLDAVLSTTNTTTANRHRPEYWGATDPLPDLTFERLATDPLPPLATSLQRWGERAIGETKF